MVTAPNSIGGILEIDCLQQIQDAFSCVFQVPVMIVDPYCTPITTPANWKMECDRLNEASIPEDCKKRLQDLLAECVAVEAPAFDVCPHSGLTTAAVPIFLDELFLGAWILDQMALEEPQEAIQDEIEKWIDSQEFPDQAPAARHQQDDFQNIFDLLLTVNIAVVQLARKNREMSIRDRQLRGINDQMDAANGMLRRFIDHSHASMYIADYYTGEILMFNRAFCEMTSQSSEGLMGRKCWEINDCEGGTFCTFCPRDKLLDDNNQPAPPHTWVYFNTKLGLWLRCTSQAITWVQGRMAHMVTQLDVTQEYRMQEELRQMAFIDAQTGLHNGQKLLHDVMAFKTKSRSGTTKLFRRREDSATGIRSMKGSLDLRIKGSLDLICLDLSPLRRVRAAFGRKTAGEMLKAILEWLDKAKPPLSTLYRIDADQYCLTLRNSTQEEINHMAHRVTARFTKPWLVRMDGNDTPIFTNVHASILFATRDHLLDRDLISLCGRTLDSAKERRQIFVYDEEVDRKSREHLRREASLVKCVKEGMEGFEVHFQPIVHLKSGVWAGLETLCRWTSPEFGSVSPMVFISDAERLGLISQIGIWVLDNAVKWAKSWNLEDNAEFFLSVNVSPLQIMDENFAEKVKAILRRHDFPGSKISLEVTESTEFAFTSFTKATIDKLIGLGLRLALDDFGTGYSSFNNLKNLPVSFLKTEKEFISGIENDCYMQYFYYIMSEIAHANEMRLIAEGVETAEQVEIIQQNGADYIQGYYFSKPLPPSEITGKIDRFMVKDKIFTDTDQAPMDLSQWLDGKNAYVLTPGLIKLLNSCLQTLLSDLPSRGSFQAVLQRVGEHFDLDRTFAFVKRGEAFDLVNEWCGPSTSPAHPPMNLMDESRFVSDLKHAFRQTGMIMATDGDPLQLGIFEALCSIENHSLALMPMWSEEELIGFVGFNHNESRPWSPEAVIMLQNLALIMSNSIKREILEDCVMGRSQIIKEMLQHSKMNAMIVDNETHEILFINDAMRNRYNLSDDTLGKRCYQVLHGGDASDDSFHWLSARAEREGTVFSPSFYSKTLEKTFTVFDSLVEWEPGRRVRIEYLIDTTDIVSNESGAAPYDGLEMRDSFFQKIDAVVQSVTTGELDRVSFAYVKVLNMESIKNSLGAQNWESLIAHVALTVNTSTRASDFVGRVDEDEIIVVFPGCPKEIGQNRLEQSLNHFLQLFRVRSGPPFSFTVFELEELAETVSMDAILGHMRCEKKPRELVDLFGVETGRIKEGW